MPGLVGLITTMPKEWAESQLSRMLETQHHARFYTSGKWHTTSIGVYVGWTAIENSFASQMPLCNPTSDVHLFFAGEEYSGDGVHAADNGCPKRNNEASYLIDCYESGDTFPARLNGIFHGLVVDSRRKTATLFNDRYGMHPVHYYQAKEAFYFGAEAKAILAVCPDLRSIDERGLAEFIAFSCVLENRTIFRQIQVMPGGSSWTFCNGTLRGKQSYFRPEEWESQEQVAPEQYRQELSNVLRSSLPRYFCGSQRTGIALTGGLDTRVLLAANKASSASLATYTFGGPLRESQDVIIARKVARECGLAHQVITVGEQFLSKFSHYAERSVYFTEGTVDAYRASDLYLSEKAREIAPAKIVGTYGSEIVQHAVMFSPTLFAQGIFSGDLKPHLLAADQTYSQARRCNPITFAAFRQSPWYHRGILSLERTQLTVRSPFLDNSFVRTVYRAPQSSKADIRLRLLADHNSQLARIRSDRGVVQNGNSMSLLRQIILQTTYKAEYLFDSGMPNWLARLNQASAAQLERWFLGRHKLLHFRVWYRDALKDYIREMLLDSRSLARPYIVSKRVETIVREHTSGTGNYTTEIHKLLTLELLHRLFFDRS